MDNVYMGRGTSDLYTLWTPFGDIVPEMGTVAVVEHSNWMEGFKPLQVQKLHILRIEYIFFEDSYLMMFKYVYKLPAYVYLYIYICS